MPPAWTRRLEEEGLAQQVARCYERAPFYREKLDGAGVRPADIRHLDDLARIPFTTKEELRASQAENPPYGDFLCADALDVVHLHLSSGTTGKPLVLPYTERDMATSAEVGARAFWSAGVRPDDTVLHCLAYSFYTGGLADRAALEATGAAMVPVRLGQSSRLLDVWNDLRPTALFCTITYPVHLAETAVERGIEPRDLRLAKLVVTGEPGGQIAGTRQRLEKLWGAQAGDTYGLSDVWGTLAGECEEREGLHFCGQGATLAELVDQDTGDQLALEEGARGELVFTHLQREAAPLLRFRTRDVVEILGLDCPCGRTGFRFAVVGRTDDMFRVRGVNVFPSAVEGLMREHGIDRFAILLESFPVEPLVRILVEGVDGRERELAQTVQTRLDFTCEISAPTLPRSEAKSKRLYRVYEGEEAPALSS